MDKADWIFLALLVGASVWLLVRHNKRINRENAEAMAERDRQLCAAVDEGIRQAGVRLKINLKREIND